MSVVTRHILVTIFSVHPRHEQYKSHSILYFVLTTPSTELSSRLYSYGLLSTLHHRARVYVCCPGIVRKQKDTIRIY